MSNDFDLDRFLKAQTPLIDQVRRELRAGRKQSHWMWFIFPQLRGLGHSSQAHFFGIPTLGDAVSYAAHPVLGPRLVECTALVNAVAGQTANAILGYPDDLKFHSCMTLFRRAAPDQQVFGTALDKYFAGAEDPGTLGLLG